MKEKLMKLFYDYNAAHLTFCDGCTPLPSAAEQQRIEHIVGGFVDYLISNGVVIRDNGNHQKWKRIAHDETGGFECPACGATAQWIGVRCGECGAILMGVQDGD